MDSIKITFSILVLLTLACCTEIHNIQVLDNNNFSQYIERFNLEDEELYIQYVSNDSALAFLSENIPLIDVPDKDIEETYYFRWWTYRKHLKETEDGFVVTEFLPPVPWAKKHNTINCPAGHHIYEGRWLRNPEYVQDYINFWLNRSDDGIRQYSFWIADALLSFQNVHPNDSILSNHLEKLTNNYNEWERIRRDSTNILFWQYDVNDGMELTVSGRIINDGVETFSVPAVRPTINSYMYGDAKAISVIADIVDDPITAREFKAKTKLIKQHVQDYLWNKELNFFTALPKDFNETTKPVNVRELIGYVPWYFNLPDDNPEFARAWNSVMDTAGFYAPFGLTVCERSHPFFQINYTGHECQWNGPSWPFATTQTLKGLSNFLNNYSNHGSISKDDFYRLFLQYAKSHSIVNEKGEKQKWIDENLNPFTGDWISRTRLKTWDNGTWSPEKGGVERGKDYNHSGFCDLVISDLLGLRPRNDNVFELRPLVPDNWDWFCLDKVIYHDKELTVIWDRSGTRYNKGKGLMIYVDGVLKVKTTRIEKIIIELE